MPNGLGNRAEWFLQLRVRVWKGPFRGLHLPAFDGRPDSSGRGRV